MRIAIMGAGGLGCAFGGLLALAGEDVAFNGTVVRLGRDFRVPTPFNFAVYAALKPYVDGAPARP